MALNEEYLERACEAFDAATGQPRNAVAATIEAYLAEMFKPSQVMTLGQLEAIPQRDYRKELWIAHWAAIDGKTKFEDAVCGTQKAVEAFDKFFSEPTHG